LILTSRNHNQYYSTSHKALGFEPLNIDVPKPLHAQQKLRDREGEKNKENKGWETFRSENRKKKITTKLTKAED